MKIDLSKLNWSLSGYSPASWQMGRHLDHTCPASIPLENYGHYMHLNLNPWSLRRGKCESTARNLKPYHKD